MIFCFSEKQSLFNEIKGNMDPVNTDGICLLKVPWVIMKATLALKSS